MMIIIGVRWYDGDTNLNFWYEFLGADPGGLPLDGQCATGMVTPEFVPIESSTTADWFEDRRKRKVCRNSSSKQMIWVIFDAETFRLPSSIQA
jgi:hypothetical protein